MSVESILDTDSYKASHFEQYPPGTEYVFQYGESRGGRYDEVVFFGLQGLILSQFMNQISYADIAYAQELFTAHGEPFPTQGWLHIFNEHNGLLPVRIRAVPEGSLVPTNIPLWTIENTDPAVPWIVSWLETRLVRLWYPITVATQSYHIRKYLYQMLEKTSDNPKAEIGFKLHDFGSRGVSSRESAMIGGCAHLVNFLGTDTVNALFYAREFYHSQMAGFSIPAAEHSTITAWGKSHEVDAYRNMLKRFARPGSLVAVVSDSYDLWNAIEHLWGEQLRQEVIDSGATVIIRPDSGDPTEVVARALEILNAKFGSKTNSKGYKVLNNVRVIQGDGVNEDSIRSVVDNFVKLGYSMSNVAFGMGGALLQQLNRDTQKFAQKASSITVDGMEHSISKSPVGDTSKKSKAGRVDTIHYSDAWVWQQYSAGEQSAFRTVFENGELLVDETLDEIRQRLPL